MSPADSSLAPAPAAELEPASWEALPLLPPAASSCCDLDAASLSVDAPPRSPFFGARPSNPAVALLARLQGRGTGKVESK